MCLLYEKVVWNKPQLSEDKTVIKYVSVLLTGAILNVKHKWQFCRTVHSWCLSEMSEEHADCQTVSVHSRARLSVYVEYSFEKNSNHRISKKYSHVLAYCHRYNWHACVVLGLLFCTCLCGISLLFEVLCYVCKPVTTQSSGERLVAH